MPRIRVLPDLLVNQIAAGEVVERPASVVKELVENAIDAGARSVSIVVVAGGRTRIEVEDDGCGMDADDALLALERHATSKISSSDDLARITTLGFRGEALPSIAAAARLTLDSAADDGGGTRVEVDFGKVTGARPHAHRRGTTVVVEDLFVRLPARRKFLRSEATELRHILAVVSGLAFARPDVALYLEHNRKPLLHLPAVAEFARRLPDLVGASRSRQASAIGHATGSATITGFLIPAHGARDLTIVVNRRPVRDRLLVTTLNRALRAPGGLLEATAFVAITLPADQVDVNVHPAKAEVRFADPGRVVAALTAAIASARPGLHGPVDVRRIVTVPARPADDADVRWAGETLPATGAASELWERDAVAPAPTVGGPFAGATLGRFLGQYRATYLLVEDASGLLLVDQHAAHERVLFERLLAEQRSAPSQRLLVPEVVELAPALAGLAGELADDLRRLGLDLEVISGNAARVSSLPAALPPAPAGRLVEGLLDDVSGGRAPGATVRDRLAAALACRAAIKKHRPLAAAEAERLLDDLAACTEMHRCPHGRPILIRLDHAEIERRIGRR